MYKNNTISPSTSQLNANNDIFDDTKSTASALQISLLENRLESEMTTLGYIMKDTVAGLTEHVNQKLSEVDEKFQNVIADLIPTGQNSNSSLPMAETRQSTIPTIQPNTCNRNTLTSVQPSQNNLGSGKPPVKCSSQQRLDLSQCKNKPQHFDVSTDFDEFQSQFK